MALARLVVAVLDTMWGARAGRAPRYFTINPYNVSGKRLYKLVGAHTLLVTNCCRELVTSARHHGKPDPTWLAENLHRLKPDIVLVCGTISKRTYKNCGYKPPAGVAVLQMHHPAARCWSKKLLEATRKKISLL